MRTFELLSRLFGGTSTVLDIMPTRKHFVAGEGIVNRKDGDALAGDWQRVGDDIRAVYEGTHNDDEV